MNEQRKETEAKVGQEKQLHLIVWEWYWKNTRFTGANATHAGKERWSRKELVLPRHVDYFQQKGSLYWAQAEPELGTLTALASAWQPSTRTHIQTWPRPAEPEVKPSPILRPATRRSQHSTPVGY